MLKTSIGRGGGEFSKFGGSVFAIDSCAKLIPQFARGSRARLFFCTCNGKKRLVSDQIKNAIFNNYHFALSVCTDSFR